MLALHGKTQCGNGRTGRNANHIVSAVDNDWFCVGEVLVDEKSNKITAISLLLDMNQQGQIVTIDAIGCQKDIVRGSMQALADTRHSADWAAEGME